jgi:hypothetical protein
MTESQTLITPRELLDTSIGQLRILAAFLGEQLGERHAGGKSDTAETRACGAILSYLTLLMQKLEGTDLDGLRPCGPPALQAIGLDSLKRSYQDPVSLPADRIRVLPREPRVAQRR